MTVWKVQSVAAGSRAVSEVMKRIWGAQKMGESICRRERDWIIGILSMLIVS